MWGEVFCFKKSNLQIQYKEVTEYFLNQKKI